MYIVECARLLIYRFVRTGFSALCSFHLSFIVHTILLALTGFFFSIVVKKIYVIGVSSFVWYLLACPPLRMRCTYCVGDFGIRFIASEYQKKQKNHLRLYNPSDAVDDIILMNNRCRFILVNTSDKFVTANAWCYVSCAAIKPNLNIKIHWKPLANNIAFNSTLENIIL